MSDLATGPEATAGQTEAPVTTDNATVPSSEPTGQATATAPTGQADSAPATDDTASFFDPSQVPPELQAAYKSMQSAFTRKMQSLAEANRANSHKIQAYDAFEQDPVTAMQQMAARMGYSLSRAEARAAVQQQGGEWDPSQGEPQSWDDVLSVATKRAQEAILQQLAPVLQNVQSMQSKSIETQLDEIDPEWRAHEQEFVTNVRQFPALAHDLKKLYRLSMPEEYVMSKATARALEKLKSTSKQAAVGAQSSQRQTQPAPIEIKSFSDAVAEAKRRLASGG